MQTVVQDFLGIERFVTRDSFVYNEQRHFYCMLQHGQSECMQKNKGREHPKLPPELERKLIKFFVPHNREFYKTVGHDFGWRTEM